MSNPYSPYFDRMDYLVPRLDAGELTDEERVELGDLIRRGLFFIAGFLNTAAQTSPMLILTPEPEAETDGDPDSEPHASRATT